VFTTQFAVASGLPRPSLDRFEVRGETARRPFGVSGRQPNTRGLPKGAGPGRRQDQTLEPNDGRPAPGPRRGGGIEVHGPARSFFGMLFRFGW